MFRDLVTSETALREIIGGEPSDMARKKELSALDPHARSFIARSPFLLLGTSGADGRCDVSPKGDAPGFVRVIDDHHLVIPDRPGNKRLDGMRNILRNPRVGIIFLLPGNDFTLRVNGRAAISRDPELLQTLAAQGKVPLLAIGVEVGGGVPALRALVPAGEALGSIELARPGRRRLDAVHALRPDEGRDVARGARGAERAVARLAVSERGDPMKFGLYSSIANPPRGEHLDRSIDEVIAEAQLAESCGFDSCFFGEHHQDRDGFLPSPLIVAAAVAARTTTLRVGTSVILLPLHHPVRVAEDVITLDLVSKGRVVLGVGIGYQPADFRAFGVPIEHRVGLFEEGVEILRRSFAGEPFSFRGKHFTLEDVTIRPRPYQKSGPPIWIGGSVGPAVRRAGQLADAFVGTPSTGMANAVALADGYKAAARAAGKTPEVIMMRDAWVAPTLAEAEAVYGPEVMAAYRYYWQNRLAEFQNIPEGTEFSMKILAPDRLIVGDPETCVREFHRWRDATGADYFLLRLRHAHSGGPPHARIMEAIRLFGDKVLPHCR